MGQLPPVKRAPAAASEASGEISEDAVDRRSALAAYMQDLRRHPLLTREEEHRIACEYVETGNPKLAEKLIAANLRLVVKIALEYRTAHGNLLDLVQEGNVGLIHAVRKYDPRRGVKLATYAAWWMRAYILRFILSNARLVKLGTTLAQRRLFFGLRRERARLEGHSGETVDAHQLATAFKVSDKEVTEMEARLAASEAPIDAPPRRGSDGRSRGDVIVSTDDGARPDVQCENREFQAALSREVEAFRKTLTGRDAVIFEGRLASEDAKTLAEIAASFGVSRERVRQIEERLKLRLRRTLVAALGDAVQDGVMSSSGSSASA
jgi:RNA polymerase sigma-32 factor